MTHPPRGPVARPSQPPSREVLLALCVVLAAAGCSKPAAEPAPAPAPAAQPAAAPDARAVDASSTAAVAHAPEGETSTAGAEPSAPPTAAPVVGAKPVEVVERWGLVVPVAATARDGAARRFPHAVDRGSVFRCQGPEPVGTARVSYLRAEGADPRAPAAALLQRRTPEGTDGPIVARWVLGDGEGAAGAVSRACVPKGTRVVCEGHTRPGGDQKRTSFATTEVCWAEYALPGPKPGAAGELPREGFATAPEREALLTRAKALVSAACPGLVATAERWARATAPVRLERWRCPAPGGEAPAAELHVVMDPSSERPNAAAWVELHIGAEGTAPAEEEIAGWLLGAFTLWDPTAEGTIGARVLDEARSVAATR